MPEVTVVIPTRDRWSVLAAFGLRAALAQEDVELEVVVVDDGSDTGVPADLAGGADRRVRVLRQAEPRGAAGARNAGIAVARGEWIAFLDDDDVWSPHKLRTQLEVARSDDADLVYAGVVVLDADASVLHADRPAPARPDDLLQRNTIPAGSSNVLARASSVRRVGGFDERLTYVSDWDLWIRLAAEGKVAVCPELLVGYVRAGSGMHFSGSAAVGEMRYFAAKHHDAGVELDPARFLRWIAAEDRLAGRRVAAASTYLRSGIAFRRPRHVLHALTTLLDVHALGARRPSRYRRQPSSVERVPDVPWLAAYR